MDNVLLVMTVVAGVVFLYNLLVLAQGPEYKTPTYPYRTTYPEQGEPDGTWPEVEEG